MPEVLGVFADAARAREDQLVQRVATSVELDRSFEEILRGAHQHNAQSRQRLDAFEAEIRQAAADSQQRAAQVQALTGRYPLRGDRTIQSVVFPRQGPPPVDPLEQILKTYQVSEDPDGELVGSRRGRSAWRPTQAAGGY